MKKDLALIAKRAKELMQNAVALYLGKSNALVRGAKCYISEDRQIFPYRSGDKWMLPVEFVLNSIGKTTQNISAIDRKAEERNGVRYAPAEELCSTLHLHLHTEENGLIICSEDDIEASLDWQSNTDIMRRICESFLFDDVTGAELAKRIEERHPDRHHPRLVLSQQQIDAIKAELAKPEPDKVTAQIFRNLKTYGDRYLREKTSGYELRDGIRLLYVCRENSNRMLTCALLYLLTGEERYAKRAFLEMYTCACFVDWNPYHFLDVGEMAMAMGLCYDWLYHWMDETERRIIREAIFQNGIMPIIDDFDDKPRKRSWNWRGDLADNWCLVISGVGLAAMSIVDDLEPEKRPFAERAMEQTLLDIRRALSLFAPLGGYEEGFSYWGYAMEYFSYTIASLEHAAGSDFGYVDVPGMRLTNRFMLAVNGSVRVFSFHDSGRDHPGTDYPPQMMFLAKRFGQYQEAIPRIRCILEDGLPDGNDAIADLIWYDPKLLQTNDTWQNRDLFLPITELATMRSGWERDALFVGFHCDNPKGDGKGHSHMDAGTFVLDAAGENFFLDLGADSYKLPDYNNTYRVRAEGHNVMVFNPGREYGQKFGGRGQIIDHQFGQEVSYAVGELTEVYDDSIGIRSYRRTVKLCDHRKKVVVQDEISLEKDAEAWWFAHTEADIELDESGKSAVLTSNGKQLQAVLESNVDARFCVLDPVPLPTSPVIEGQDPNEGVRKLAIHFEHVNTLSLSVSFFVKRDDER